MQILSIKICTFTFIGGFTIYFWNSPKRKSSLLKKAFIITYGAESDIEKETFKKLVERNSKNMSFISYDIIFTTEKEAENIAKKVVEQQWKK